MNTSSEPWVGIVREKVARMRYGSVLVTIHDGRVTQVESTEKTRLPEHLSDRHEPEGNIHGTSHHQPGARA